MRVQLDFLLHLQLKSSIGCSLNRLACPRKINASTAMYITILQTLANGLQEMCKDLSLQFSLDIFSIVFI